MIGRNMALTQGIRRALRAPLALSMVALGLSLGTVHATGSQTVTFDNVPGTEIDSTLDGQFPQGVIDWGSGSWFLSGPWQDLSNNSISFNGDELHSATFNFLSPSQLVKLNAYNGDEHDATVTLSCTGAAGAAQSQKVFHLGGFEMQTLETGWTSSCSMVTISTSNGWETNFDKLVIQ